MCKANDVVYETVCAECDKTYRQDTSRAHKGRYIGETYRSLYERSIEHVQALKRFDPRSFMVKHWAKVHFNDNSAPEFQFKVIKKHNDPLSRKVHEAVRICTHASMNSKSEWGGFKLNRLTIDESDFEKIKGVTNREAETKAEAAIIKSLKDRVDNIVDFKSKSSCRKRKERMFPAADPARDGAKVNNCGDELGARPKKRVCQGQQQKLPATPATSGKRRTVLTPKTPSVAQWLTTLQPPPSHLHKTSTPVRDTSLDHKSVLEPAHGVMSSTQVSELLTKSMDCDVSTVREDFSFGSNRSSTEGHLNEAMDRSEACKSFENPDQTTKEILINACEKSKNAIDLYCGPNGENLEILVRAPVLDTRVNTLSSEAIRNEHLVPEAVKTMPYQNPGPVASFSTLLRPKLDAKMDAFSENMAVPDDNFLREAREASASIWDNLVKKTKASKGNNTNVRTFKEAFERAQLYKSPIDACSTHLENLCVGTRRPTYQPPGALAMELGQTHEKPLLAADLGKDVGNSVLPPTLTPVLGQNCPATEPLMDEMGQDVQLSL